MIRIPLTKARRSKKVPKSGKKSVFTREEKYDMMSVAGHPMRQAPKALREPLAGSKPITLY